MPKRRTLVQEESEPDPIRESRRKLIHIDADNPKEGAQSDCDIEEPWNVGLKMLLDILPLFLPNVSQFPGLIQLVFDYGMTIEVSMDPTAELKVIRAPYGYDAPWPMYPLVHDVFVGNEQCESRVAAGASDLSKRTYGGGIIWTHIKVKDWVIGTHSLDWINMERSPLFQLASRAHALHDNHYTRAIERMKRRAPSLVLPATSTNYNENYTTLRDCVLRIRCNSHSPFAIWAVDWPLFCTVRTIINLIAPFPFILTSS